MVKKSKGTAMCAYCTSKADFICPKCGTTYCHMCGESGADRYSCMDCAPALHRLDWDDEP